MNRIPLLVPRMPRAETLLPYLQQIDRNQWYTNFGPLNGEFERRILADAAPQLNASNITTVSNCTVGLELALQALELPAGAGVLIPAITFVATATAVARVGLVPVLADVDSETWVLTPAIARTALDGQPVSAVMPVSTFGYAHNPSTWDAFTHETGIPVVIDAAGAYGNQHVGSSTDVVYSFHATKSFGAAEGGAIVSSHAERISAIRRLSNFGIDTATGCLVGLGTNGKMSEYHCAIGLASFDGWSEVQCRRRELHRRYVAILRSVCPELAFQDKDPEGVYPLMPVAIPHCARVEDVRMRLAQAGIETRRWYSPSLHTHPALQQAPRASSLEHATDLGERIIGLPFFIGLQDAELEHIATTLAASVQANQVML